MSVVLHGGHVSDPKITTYCNKELQHELGTVFANEVRRDILICPLMPKEDASDCDVAGVCGPYRFGQFCKAVFHQNQKLAALFFLSQGPNIFIPTY